MRPVQTVNNEKLLKKCYKPKEKCLRTVKVWICKIWLILMMMLYKETLKPTMNTPATTRKNLINSNNSGVKASINFPISSKNPIFTHKVR